MILYTASGSRINTMILLIGILYLQTNMFSKLNIKKNVKVFIHTNNGFFVV